jgi:hypothetical protein
MSTNYILVVKKKINKLKVIFSLALAALFPFSSHALPRASAKENKTMDQTRFFRSRKIACQL